VSTIELAEHILSGSTQLRNEPVQARSTARLAALLDAAAAVIDEVGYERLTTAMVAERAGASIGTVYRYFPDRIAVLQALGARNLDRVLADVRTALAGDADGFDATLAAAFEVIVEAFRSEPGFRALRVGDVIDLRPAPNERTFNSVVSEAIHTGLVARFGISASDEASFAFETAVEVADALAARAFARDTSGDESFLSAGRALISSTIAPFSA
jgi:AcrR family transcriptional regulator